MAFCRGLISLLVLCIVSVSLAVEVPVFLWGDLGRSSKHSALSSVPAAEFRKILKHELIEDPFTVVFIEETLSVEDLSRKIDESTSFPYLESEVDDAVYLPLVQDPLKVLNKLADSSLADHVKLTDNGLSADVSSDEGKFLFINLKDAKEGESREDLLRRHNDFMEDMFVKLQERYNKVVAIYTAHYPSWTVVEHSRVRRQVETKPKDSTTPDVTSLDFRGLKMYFQRAILTGASSTTVLSGAKGDDSSFVNETLMNSTLTFSDDVRITLNFASKDGYWFLNSASLSSAGSGDQTLYPSDAERQLFGFSNFSYRCSANITLQTRDPKPVNGSSEVDAQHWTLIFHNSRIQPYFVNDSSSLAFGDMLNCTGFFTAPIWAGLFITFVLLSITFFGIMMMMDIKTMDRFDDPKGKTITINAE